MLIFIKFSSFVAHQRTIKGIYDWATEMKTYDDDGVSTTTHPHQ